jgi:hypothetical protein
VRARFALACLVAGIVVPSAGAAQPVVRTGLSPQAILFGDPVQATVVVTVDSRVDDPSTLAISTPTAPWTVAARSAASTTRAGALVSRRFTLTIVCRSTACLPAQSSRVFDLPPVTLTVRRRAGGVTPRRAAWPKLVVASRLPPGAAAATDPPFELQTTPPPVAARVSASRAALVLDAAAVLLGLAAVWLTVLEVRRRRRRSAAAVSPLARALALLREAEQRPAPDRRRALSLLSRVTPRPQETDVADDATVAAWSPDDPTPEQLSELSRRLEEHR